MYLLHIKNYLMWCVHNGTVMFCAVILEQHQDMFRMMSLEALAHVFSERGVLFIFHNQHQDMLPQEKHTEA